MNQPHHKGLLPTGLQDGLPPDALAEARAIERLLADFAAFGYERVKPPLVEFEESLLAGPGAALSPQLFRLMDPISQRMMGVRADITPQIARIVATRLSAAPRPLRLCYAGQVLRVRGSQLRPERQFAQAGVELIGATAISADAEVISLAAESLQALGIERLSIDLTVPTLVPAVARHFGFDEAAAADVRKALDRKDAGALQAIDGVGDTPLSAFLAAGGPAIEAVGRLSKMDLGPAGNEMVESLAELLGMIRTALPALDLTVDPGEYRGFEYQTGIAFAVFAKGVRGELGRGGRYIIDSGEPATGFTLYLDTLMRALPTEQLPPRLFLPEDTDLAEARRLRADGWVTVAGLDPAADAKAEAIRQGCTHMWSSGKIEPLD
ncbi:MAG: ATP phosphoribosyltransferase regulatory subunit [Minwuiales bacterium]|nr:ATP phosphoribosyltransferase regulatory subunit [Minwuiales bacterium]